MHDRAMPVLGVSYGETVSLCVAGPCPWAALCLGKPVHVLGVSYGESVRVSYGRVSPYV